ncbi:L-aspartate oxidase [Aquabacter cavernae]|uniref:L-aspartate oxidase n=1 Tax=Aquabacter cavernae TaxID=2496029 RepID=UPI000F8D3648|nr:L-aspartate oxidase [Aquabacter cavernae]
MAHILPADTDRVIVVGAGLAGIATALELAPLPVLLVAPDADRTRPAIPASALAQGGIAAALGPDDHPAFHAQDTQAAGAGLCDPALVARVTGAAERVVAQLLAWGVPLDRDADGTLARGLEAAHGRARILHAGGDATGRHVLEALAARAAAAPHVTRLTARAHRLVVREDRVTGLWCETPTGPPVFLSARAVVLATGGIGGLYAATTNPSGALGAGLALAARAGAVLRDMEFVQFHPTALDVKADPLPLATEALRGAGAVLVDGTGAPVMAGIPGGDLAPRDVVARALHERLAAGGRVFLDARGAPGTAFARLFPSVHALCARYGMDPAHALLPVRPAAHYHMGGIKVDGAGRASLDGLYACGEVASTGLHGANRLASNSLLEALAFARWIADDIRDRAAPYDRTPATPIMPGSGRVTADVRAMMEAHVGVVRHQAGLSRALDTLLPRAARCDAALVAALVALGALRREESRGGHFRADFPETGTARHGELTLAALLIDHDATPPQRLGVRTLPAARATSRNRVGAKIEDVA